MILAVEVSGKWGAGAVVLIGALLAGLAHWFFWRTLKHLRLLVDTPCCKARGVFIGYVEVKGAAQTGRPLQGPLSSRACVHYHWQVAEHYRRRTTYRDSKGRSRTRTESGWQTVRYDKASVPFDVRDDTGSVLIQPAGAAIDGITTFERTCGISDPLYYGMGPAGGVSGSTGQRRFTETAIPLESEVFVTGQARERGDSVAPEITKPEDDFPFRISTRTEEQIGKRLRWKIALCGLGAMAASGVVLVITINVFVGKLTDVAGWGVVATGAFLSLWVLASGSAVILYNSLIALRNRVARAKTLIDVELKRRHDLIPHLVEATRGMAAHEQSLQTDLAALRATSENAASAGLILLAERHPGLKSDTTFQALHAELVNTQDRIALARNYYAEIASFYNTRLQTVPDAWIALPTGCRAAPLQME
jgi:hypothetical protein